MVEAFLWTILLFFLIVALTISPPYIITYRYTRLIQAACTCVCTYYKCSSTAIVVAFAVATLPAIRFFSLFAFVAIAVTWTIFADLC